MRANPPPIELRHWDYFRRVLGIAAEGLPCCSKQPDDLKQRLKDAIKKWKCDADVFNDVKACRDAFSHFDFDFSPEDFPEVKGAGGGGGCVASADHAKEPITVNLCFERVRKMLGVTKCEVSSKQLDDFVQTMGSTCRTEQSAGRRQELNVVAKHRQAYSCSAAKQSQSGPSSSFFFAVLISLHFHHHKIITSQSRDCLCKVAAVPLHASCSSAPLLLTSAACFHFFIALVERGLRAEGMG